MCRRRSVAHVLDELGGDRQVVLARDLLPVPAGVRRDALRFELQRQDVREPFPETVHRPVGPLGIGKRHGDEVPLVVRVLSGADQVIEVPAEHAEPPVDRCGDQFGPRDVARPDLDQPGALLVAGLGERIRQRGSAVPHAVRDRLLAVQVPERDVAESVEQRRGHRADAADGDVPLGVAALPAVNPAVRQHDGPRLTPPHRIGPDQPGRPA
jgi:hypothetical protein